MLFCYYSNYSYKLKFLYSSKMLTPLCSSHTNTKDSEQTKKFDWLPRIAAECTRQVGQLQEHVAFMVL